MFLQWPSILDLEFTRDSMMRTFLFPSFLLARFLLELLNCTSRNSPFIEHRGSTAAPGKSENHTVYIVVLQPKLFDVSLFFKVAQSTHIYTVTQKSSEERPVHLQVAEPKSSTKYVRFCTQYSPRPVDVVMNIKPYNKP